MTAYPRAETWGTTTAGVSRPLKKAKLGIIGCGDVAARCYVPALADMAPSVELVGCCDARTTLADALVASVASWSPRAQSYPHHDEMLADAELDGVLILTPAPSHGELVAAALNSRRHVFAEKPIATSVGEAQALIRTAEDAGLLLLSAPAVMATPRFQWLRRMLAGGRIGRPTLATGQLANLGPAAWPAYTGDPDVYYSAEVGPLLDQGIYLLHAITGLFGPARSVQAVGAVAIPTRRVTAGPHIGREVRVRSKDHLLMHLEFDDGALAQVLSSYAVPATKAPTLEIHGTSGSVSLHEAPPLTANGPVDVYLRDESDMGLSGWLDDLRAPAAGAEPGDLIAAGPQHFVRCLVEGETPILDAAHACHVLEIALKAIRSVEQRAPQVLTTSFGAR